MRWMLLFCLISCVVVTGCSETVAPEPGFEPASSSLQDLGRTRSVSDENLARLRHPMDDPRIWVFEDLGPAELKANMLEVGECVIQYRRFNGQYTPIPFRLSRTLRSRVSRGAESVRVVQRVMRGTDLAARAVCRFPASGQAFQEAAQQLRAQIVLPATKRNADGSRSLTQPSSSGGRLGESASALGAMPNPLIGSVSALALVDFVLGWLGPQPLAAQDDECTLEPEDTCILPPIIVEGEDPCDDSLGYWDDFLQECLCWNGSEWGSDCTPPEEEDDTTSTGDGGGSDSGGIGDAMADLVEENPFVLLEYPCNEIPAWLNLHNHTVPQSVQDRLTTELGGIFGLGAAWIQTIEDASGPTINLDYYAVTVPIVSIPGGLSPEDYLNHVRTGINDFVDIAFDFYPGLVGEQQRWAGTNPLGTVFSIQLAPINDGSVVATDFDSDHWTFTTIWTAADGNHPVAGHRTFGVMIHGDNTATFYTRGVDRIFTPLDAFLDSLTPLDIYESGADVWKGFQQHLKAELGPSAVIHDEVYYRPKYEQIEAVLSGEAPVESLSECPPIG